MIFHHVEHPLRSRRPPFKDDLFLLRDLVQRNLVRIASETHERVLDGCPRASTAQVFSLLNTR